MERVFTLSVQDKFGHGPVKRIGAGTLTDTVVRTLSFVSRIRIFYRTETIDDSVNPALSSFQRDMY